MDIVGKDVLLVSWASSLVIRRLNHYRVHWSLAQSNPIKGKVFPTRKVQSVYPTKPYITKTLSDLSVGVHAESPLGIVSTQSSSDQLIDSLLNLDDLEESGS